MGKKKAEIIGAIDDIVISILNLSIDPNTPIYISETNIEHMKKAHPEDYEKYGKDIGKIIANPDYVAKHPKNDSVQYIKVYYDENRESKILVAIRSSRKGIMYARSLFTMSEEKVDRYQKNGYLKKVN